MSGILTRKKNVMIISLAAITCFIVYQLYFFLILASENMTRKRIVPVIRHSDINQIVPLRSESDKFVSENGVFKGVLSQNFLKYRPDSSNNFKCLNLERSIPFEWVNDDYCDCEDGTDEPSTSACINATFYCDTQYKRPVTLNSIPSSKVNDGICDCCDGSDEWLHEATVKLLSQSNDRHYRHYVAKCPNLC